MTRMITTMSPTIPPTPPLMPYLPFSFHIPRYYTPYWLPETMFLNNPKKTKRKGRRPEGRRPEGPLG